MDTSSRSVFEAGRVLQDRYRLDEAIALGGMAEVWRGHDLILDRPVAIKLLHPHLSSDPALVERFRREAVSAARLSHPHIVPTYDTGTDEGVTYIVLGLIHGPTLAQRLAQSKMDVSDAVSVARQVADALQHAHDSGLVHRDIKPSNVLIVDNDHRIMVADFGIAKAVAESADESLTLPGFILGTPAYLAPEQLEGRDADARSDVYAVGVLLHEMICGHTSTDQPTQLSVTGDDGSAITPTCDELPEGIRPIVAKATAENPDDRYATAAELCRELFQFEESHRTSASAKASTRSRVAGRSRRNRNEPPYAHTVDTDEHNAVPAASSPTQHIEPRPGARRSTFDFEPDPSRPGRRRRVLTAVIAIALVILAILVGMALRRAADSGSTPTTAAPQMLAITSARSFDPLGDRSENQAGASNAFDGNPGTAWSTQTYSNRNFGNLKAGVGIVLQLNGSANLRQLTLDTASSGFSASIYVASGSKDRLEDWGRPVDTQSGLNGTATFDLHSTTGDNVLVWITDLGSTNRFTLNEARIAS